MPRPPNDFDKMAAEWDGVIKHTNRGPGQSGFRKHGCRCPECCEAGKKMYARRREDGRKRRAKIRAGEIKSITHGVTGYRQYGCRCEICTPAGKAHNAWVRQRDAGKWAAAPTPEEEEIDLEKIEHLKPGYGVRRRTPNDK